MNPQLGVVTNRHFWMGVAATFIVGVLAATGVPNLMRTRMSMSQGMQKYAVAELVASGGGGSGDRDAFYASDDGRKMVRTASIDLLVKSPKEASEKIRLLATQASGFLISSETYGGESASSASLAIRIPVDKFELVRAEISKLGVRVESEKLEAQDVTKQYVDLSARLHNFHAQEAQYLGIMKQAKTVKDTIEVSDKLNEVRAQIEQQQAEFDALSKQVETVALTINLHAEADAKIFGLRWRPLYQLKIAARDGIDGVGDYAVAMAAFIFYIPAILLWLATVVAGLAVAWRTLRWARRKFFVQLKTESSG
jgi:cell division protein FtsL